jgi:hypothetical protein
MPLFSGLVNRFEKINASLERHFWRYSALLLALFLASSIAQDLRSKMWLDELFTLFVAKESGPAQIVKAIKEGCDGLPPLYALIVHLILPVVKHDGFAVRLPATIGYGGMILCMLAFCRRRLPAVYSFIAPLLACNACLYYSTEGRPYGLVAGCAAGALLCWQIGAEGYRRSLVLPLLSLCLALMVALHYYAVFFLIPLLLGELVRARSLKKLDFSFLAAILPAPLVLALHYPLISSARQFQLHYWSIAYLGMVTSFFNEYFYPILAICSISMFVLALLPHSSPTQGVYRNLLPSHEWAVLGALTLMPPLVVSASTYTTHVFGDRYILWTVIGFALLACVMLCMAAHGQSAVGVTVLAVLLALLAKQELEPWRQTPVLREGQGVLRELEKLPAGNEAIIVANGHIFMELSYYAGDPIRQRLVYPLSRELDLRYENSDTSALIFQALRRRTSLPIKDLDTILSANHRFLLAATRWEYLPWHLVSVGYHVVPLRSATPHRLLYEVEAPR